MVRAIIAPFAIVATGANGRPTIGAVDPTPRPPPSDTKTGKVAYEKSNSGRAQRSASSAAAARPII
jgi:hypothetical protein